MRDICYTKLECVGRGGSSKVYKVMAPNRKIFALKRIRLQVGAGGHAWACGWDGGGLGLGKNKAAAHGIPGSPMWSPPALPSPTAPQSILPHTPPRPAPTCAPQGRDAEAASGFLDEIRLLNSLAGRSNIIQLIDSEVGWVGQGCGVGVGTLAPPALHPPAPPPAPPAAAPALPLPLLMLQPTALAPALPACPLAPQVHRSEGLIYMVLEFGDIDLARLLQVGCVHVCVWWLLGGG